MILACCLAVCAMPCALADEGFESDTNSAGESGAGAVNGSSAGAEYDLGQVVNTGTDSGFRGEQALRKGDPHFDWSIGRFYLTGYSDVAEEDRVVVFRVPSGGHVTLWFELEQRIDMLNGDPALSISQDTNGRDDDLGVPEQDFGRGALIVKDSSQASPEVVTDFLQNAADNADRIKVGEYGVGDYEVALDYEIREDALVMLGISIFPSFTNYQLSFAFDVREGGSGAAVVGVDSNTAAGNGEALSDDGADSSSGAANGNDEEGKSEPAGMPWWQIAIMVAAIGAGSLLVINGERRKR